MQHCQIRYLQLKTIDKIEEIDTHGRLVRIIERLPLHLQGRWRSESVKVLDRTGKYPRMEQFVQFLDRASRELNDLLFGCVRVLKFYHLFTLLVHCGTICLCTSRIQSNVQFVQFKCNSGCIPKCLV